MTPAEELAALRNENQRLQTDLTHLRVQLLKARQQRHDAHNQLRAILANRNNQTPSMSASSNTSSSSAFLSREEAWKALQEAAEKKYGKSAKAVEIEAEIIDGKIQPVSLQQVIVRIPQDARQ